MYNNAIGSQIISRRILIDPTIKAKFDESSNFLKWGIDIWDYHVSHPDTRNTEYKGWTFSKITDNIEQLYDNLNGWIKQYPSLQVSPSLSRNLDKAYEIFTRKHTWTDETDPADSDIAPSLKIKDGEMVAGFAGLSPKIMMIAGGAIAVVLVGILIFGKSK
ncbi:unnamed protein product [marine sediment metagenome]|uniref:Uncharacterized protein n=1 Tax=marine sediment metagenome TaxID=412755 RepID=X1JLL4_9ZZZZ